MNMFPNRQLFRLPVIALGLSLCVQFFGCRHSSAETEEIQVAVVSQAIIAREDSSSLYFLRLGSQHIDPGPGLLAKIQQSNPQVRLGSSTTENPPFLERGSGKQGVSIWVGEPRFSAFGKATVELGVMAGFLAGGGSEIYLKKIHGHWQVVGGKPTWIS
jgi:hypothetical protein